MILNKLEEIFPLNGLLCGSCKESSKFETVGRGQVVCTKCRHEYYWDTIQKRWTSSMVGIEL